MRHLSHRIAVSAAASLLVGQWLSTVGSARADEPPPAAADLVELAVTIPDAVSRLKILDAELERVTQLRGVAPRSEVERVRIEREAAQRKLELLRMVVQAELDVTSKRYARAKSLREQGISDTSLEERAAELRQELLRRMLTAARVEPEEREDHAGSQAVDAVGTFSGVVSVLGELPEPPRRARKKRADGRQLGRSSDEVIPDESLVVGPSRGLANVFVYLAATPLSVRSSVPNEPVILTSRNRQFRPRCAIVRVGQVVQLNNDDPVTSNAHFYSVRNTQWSYGIRPNEYAGPAVRFNRAEPTPIRIGDDKYPWKRAYHLVVDHPFAALTDEAGRFRIGGLPPGEHVFRIWHERVGDIEPEYLVVVGDDGAAYADITVEAEQLLDEDPGG